MERYLQGVLMNITKLIILTLFSLFLRNCFTLTLLLYTVVILHKMMNTNQLNNRIMLPVLIKILINLVKSYKICIIIFAGRRLAPFLLGLVGQQSSASHPSPPLWKYQTIPQVWASLKNSFRLFSSIIRCCIA